MNHVEKFWRQIKRLLMLQRKYDLFKKLKLVKLLVLTFILIL